MAPGDEVHRAVQEAVREERMRITSGLLRLRDRLDGKAKAETGNGHTAEDAYRDAASMVVNFVNDKIGG